MERPSIQETPMRELRGLQGGADQGVGWEVQRTAVGR
jgi:hypothetical protein